MRIAYVSLDRGVPVFGSKGCSLHVQEVIRALHRQGAAVDLFAAATGGHPPLDLADVPVCRLDRPAIDDRAAREAADLAFNRQAHAALTARAPYDLVYERYSLWSHAGMSFARAAGIPGVLEVNAPLIEEQSRYRGLIDRDAALATARRCFADASVIVAVSSGVADYLDGFDEARGKVHVVPNGVNPDRFFIRAQRPMAASSEITVGFVGTLKPWHGVDQLLQAFADLHRRFPQTRLLLVGDGPEADRLKDRVADARLEAAVEFSGAVAPDQVPLQLARMDVGVAPYPNLDDFYFSPLKIYEYMAAGLPVVASEIGQIPEIVVHGQTGLLYPADDIQALADALATLIQDRSLAARLGSHARETSLQNHSWDSRVEQILMCAGFALTPHQALIQGTG